MAQRVPPTTMTPDPLAAMLNLQRRQAPQVNLEADRTSRLRELLHNLEMAKGNPTMTVGATPSDVIGLQSDIEEDPYTGEEADEEVAYNQPFQTARRAEVKQDALDRLLIPRQPQHQQALELANVKNKGLLEAAQAKGFQAQAKVGQGQQFKQQQGMESAQQKFQRDRNQALEKQAVAREKQGGYDFWNSLLGRPTNAQTEAAKIRGGIVAPGGASQDQGIVAQMFAEAPDASPDEVALYLQGLGVEDPETVQALIAQYQQLQGGR